MEDWQLILVYLSPLVALSLVIGILIRRKRNKKMSPARGPVSSSSSSPTRSGSFSSSSLRVPASHQPTPRTAMPSLMAETKAVTPEILVDKVLAVMRDDYREFVSLVRLVLQHFPPAELLKNEELKRKFSHIDMMMQIAGRNNTSLPSGKSSDQSSLLHSPDVKANLVSIVRVLQEMPAVQEKLRDSLNPMVDSFLEKL